MTNSSPWYRWPIEIDGLPFLIAWWIFPWRTVSHNQRVPEMGEIFYQQKWMRDLSNRYRVQPTETSWVSSCKRSEHWIMKEWIPLMIHLWKEMQMWPIESIEIWAKNIQKCWEWANQLRMEASQTRLGNTTMTYNMFYYVFRICFVIVFIENGRYQRLTNGTLYMLNENFGVILDYPLVNCHITMERSTMLFMGKSTISMAMFNSYFDITRPGMDQSADQSIDRSLPLIWNDSYPRLAEAQLVHVELLWFFLWHKNMKWLNWVSDSKLSRNYPLVANKSNNFI